MTIHAGAERGLTPAHWEPKRWKNLAISVAGVYVLANFLIMLQPAPDIPIVRANHDRPHRPTISKQIDTKGSFAPETELTVPSEIKSGTIQVVLPEKPQKEFKVELVNELEQKPWDAVEVAVNAERLKKAHSTIADLFGESRFGISSQIRRQDGNPTGWCWLSKEGQIVGKITAGGVMAEDIAAHEQFHAEMDCILRNSRPAIREGFAVLAQFMASGFPEAVDYPNLNSSLDTSKSFFEKNLNEEGKNYLSAGMFWWKWWEQNPDSLKQLRMWGENYIMQSPNNEPPLEEQVIAFMDTVTNGSFSEAIKSPNNKVFLFKN